MKTIGEVLEALDKGINAARWYLEKVKDTRTELKLEAFENLKAFILEDEIEID